MKLLHISQLVLRTVFMAVYLLIGFNAFATEPAYQPKAVPVTDRVYAIVGPLSQRSQSNAGLNANYGFVVSDTGVILIDSGASAYSAKLLETAVKQITTKPIRWVVNTGSQDHRWLGNDYFAKQGAHILAMAATVQTQKAMAQQQIIALERFVGDQIKQTLPQFAQQAFAGTSANMTIDGVPLQWHITDAHFPGDAMIYLPTDQVSFTGDLVYVDRLLAILPQSNVRKASAAFEVLNKLAPKYIVPGHGKVTNLQQARAQTADYYTFLINHVGAAGRNMGSLTETLDTYASPEQFKHLYNFQELHRANMSRVFVDFESNP